MNNRMTLPLLAMVTASASGCYSTWDLSPEMVWRLDGFHGTPQKLEVVEKGQRKEVEFTSNTYLHIQSQDGLEVDSQFRALRLNGPVLVGLEAKSGDQLHVDLRQVKLVQVSNLSTAKTALAATGYTVGLAGAGATIGIGILFSLMSGGEGRPLRLKGRESPVTAPLVFDKTRRGRGRMSRTDTATQSKLFARWARAASEECASIPAFLALARDLELASAPTTLVRAALRAAREETNHTRLCTNLANTYGGMAMATRTPAIPDNMDVDYESLLRRLALESFWDGCVAEGAAAAVARRSAPQATDETTRLALQTIAHDETNHAALARDILAYCLSAGGHAVRNALLESVEHRRTNEEAQLEAMVRDEMDDPLVDTAFARKYGLAETNVKHAARIETWEKNVASIATV